MRNAKFILSALIIAVASIAAAPQINAQEDNRDENGKMVRHPYLTNGLWNNWFVGVGGGANFFFDGGYDPEAAPAIDITVGKWVTPSVGFRVGYQGVYGSEWSRHPSILGQHLNGKTGKYLQRFNFTYLHADFMWNFTNSVFGYKETRFWNIIPYVHTGLLGVFESKGAPQYGDLELAFGAGILQNFRLCDRLDLTLDVRAMTAHARYHLNTGGFAGEVSATIGLAVDLGKNNWVRASSYHNPADQDKIAAAEAATAALAAAGAALSAEKAKAEKENAALEAERARLEKAIDDALNNKGLKEVSAASFFFEIGKTELSAKELKHLDYYMQNVLPNVNNGKATVVTGTADSNTGYAKRNEYLSKKRAEYLINLLNTKYGIATENVVVKNSVIKAAKGQAAFDRAVVISFE